MQLQNQPELNPETIKLALEDIQRVTEQQRQLRQDLTTKLNILFVTNSALLSFMAISRLISFCNLFTLLELLALGTNFVLLFGAFVPSQPSASPNLITKEFVENYPTMEPDEYHLQMLYDLQDSYIANQQRLDDIAQMVLRSAGVTGVIAVVVIVHIFASYLMPELKQPGCLSLLW